MNIDGLLKLVYNDPYDECTSRPTSSDVGVDEQARLPAPFDIVSKWTLGIRLTTANYLAAPFDITSGVSDPDHLQQRSRHGRDLALAVGFGFRN